MQWGPLMDDKTWRAEIAGRLRALQQALGASNREMAAYCGCGEKSWWTYIKPSHDFPPDYAYKLKERFGVTFEWFYTNDASRNPPELQHKIDEALRNPAPRFVRLEKPIHK